MAARTLAGLLLILVGLAASAVLLHLFLRAGFPRPQDGAKSAVYLWLLTLGVALPVTAGVALVRRSRSWRRFTGWWLLAMGNLVFGSLWWFGSGYRDWLASVVVGSAVCVLPAIGGGAFLLLWTGRSERRARQRDNAKAGAAANSPGAAAEPFGAPDTGRDSG
jgi:hypothetical protein